MKKQYLTVLLAVIGLFVLGAVGHAQEEGKVVAKIPCEFVAGGKTLPAATYSITRISVTAIFLTNGTWAQTKNLEAIATLKFYPAAQGNSFAVGTVPGSVVFDGSNIWVANTLVGSITKLRASDGAKLGTFPTRDFAAAMAFDGASIWVASLHQHSVTKMRASDGASLGTFQVGLSPRGGLAFDSEHVGFEFLCQHDHQAARQRWNERGHFLHRRGSVRRRVRWSQYLGGQQYRQHRHQTTRQ
jgi:hypothetical protein